MMWNAVTDIPARIFLHALQSCLPSLRSTSFGEREEALLVQQPVEVRITLTSCANKACKRKCVEIICVNAVLVNLSDVQLHRSMLFRCDQAIRSRAFAWQVQINNSSLLVLHGRKSGREWTTF